MNEIMLSGVIKNIEHSHSIDGIDFDKANLIVCRDNGNQDIINLRFKSFSNNYKENDFISIKGNIRSYSYKIDNEKNRVIIYVFTYFDIPDKNIKTNIGCIDGRICKINPLRITKSGKHNIHFIIANNLHSLDNKKRLNSYIPCIAWGNLARQLQEYPVSTKISLHGQLHSREHKKILDNNDIEIRIAHEFVVSGFEVRE